MGVPSVAIPAATILLARERAGTPELLMLERSPALAFAPGALVFPGGRIDPGDHVLAAMLPDGPADAAARIAGIRETIEETGIALGLDLEPAARADLRSRLAAGSARMPCPRLDTLVPFARWRPSEGVSRVFDTRFYLAMAPEGAEASIDGGEHVRLAWASAAGHLAAADRGEASLLFPTRRVLERVATFASFAAAAADAQARTERIVTPWIERRHGRPHLCIPSGLGYPVTAEPLAHALRG